MIIYLFIKQKYVLLYNLLYYQILHLVSQSCSLNSAISYNHMLSLALLKEVNLENYTYNPHHDIATSSLPWRTFHFLKVQEASHPHSRVNPQGLNI